MYAGGENAEYCRVLWPLRRKVNSCSAGVGSFAAGCGPLEENDATLLELVGTEPWQLIAQHKRASAVAVESFCKSAALQQSIISMSVGECSGTPADTLPLSAATMTRDVNHFSIAISDSTDSTRIVKVIGGQNTFPRHSFDQGGAASFPGVPQFA